MQLEKSILVIRSKVDTMKKKKHMMIALIGVVGI